MRLTLILSGVKFFWVKRSLLWFQNFRVKRTNWNIIKNVTLTYLNLLRTLTQRLGSANRRIWIGFGFLDFISKS